MLTSLHLRGEVAVAGRSGGQRLWDLARRFLPHTEALPYRTAQRELAARRFRALGVHSSPRGWEAHPDAEAGEVPDRVTLLRPSTADPRPRPGRDALRLPVPPRDLRPQAKREYGELRPPDPRRRPAGRARRAFSASTANSGKALELLGAWGDTSRLDEAPRARGALGVAGSATDAGHAFELNPLSTIAGMEFETKAIHAGQEPDPGPAP